MSDQNSLGKYLVNLPPEISSDDEEYMLANIGLFELQPVEMIDTEIELFPEQTIPPSEPELAEETIQPGPSTDLQTLESGLPSCPKRFKTMEENELQSLKENFHQSKATKNNTKWGVKLFQEWCLESSGGHTDFNTVTKVDLNNKLRHFYAEAKPKNTEKRAQSMPQEHAGVYHKNSLKNVRAALNRHLTDINREIDIVKDNEFRQSNVILDSTLKMMVATGLSRPTKHKDIIELEDLRLISTYVFSNTEDAVLLRLKVWYCLAIHFVSRGLEFHHQLNLNSFDFKIDADGDEYVMVNHETTQKNIQGGVSSEEAPSDKFMYSNVAEKRFCPLSALKELIAKTDPNAKSLFNRIVKDLDVSSGASVWYTTQALAKRTYSGLMSDICKNAKCSKVYTAHCLRATAIQCMNDAGHELRHIMYMTGHRNESSIRSYNRHCSVGQKKSLSLTLSRIATGNDATSVQPTAPTSTALCPNSGFVDQNVIPSSQNTANLTSTLNSAGIMNNSMFSSCTFHINLPSTTTHQS
ncbi:KCTD1_15 [Mytilus edulis]|uniref:KCTD1_15 n=1 Tax=Mytilus edulis TaxID=6550 RepID=A0A8S3V752_MYTED|nr:KCTD1_15 [Mytilus edulis]